MQISLFDRSGNPIAYLDTSDQNVIYLWNGIPVCYIENGNKIYGFNGLHIGWYEDGMVRDLQGYKIGFIQSKSPVITRNVPIKSIKKIKPIKSSKQIARLKPIYKLTISNEYLMPFLIKGAKLK